MSARSTSGPQRGACRTELARARWRRAPAAVAAIALVALPASCGDESRDELGVVQPVFLTDQVDDDADDPAIWLAADRCDGYIIGTNKAAAPHGALVVFDLAGRRVQVVDGIDRPNNVDVEHGWRTAAGESDIAVVTERNAGRVLVFEITDERVPLVEIGGFDVLHGETGQRSEPMGISTYRRPSDGEVFVIVAPKDGGAVDHLWQYRLDRAADGEVTASLVRRFGHHGDGSSPPEGEVEAIVVDDELGYVYYADERYGIRKWHADPDHVDAATELAVFGRSGYDGDREGLAIYADESGTGLVVSVDQTPDRSTLHLYPRAGGSGPHDHDRVEWVLVEADTTDGVEVTSSPLPGLPAGAAVVMDSDQRAFGVFDWRSLTDGTTVSTTETSGCGPAESGR